LSNRGFDFRLQPQLDQAADGIRQGGIEDLELDESDDEPSLGSGAVGVYSTQSHWSQPGGGSDDREEDAGDDREEENEHCDGHAESEPSLGWSEGMAQGQGRWGGTDDRELTAEPSAASVKTARKRPQSQQLLQRHADTGCGVEGGIKLTVPTVFHKPAGSRRRVFPICL
jgi:hypothetical protein